MKGARAGFRLGNAELLDSMIVDGLWDVYENFHMGMTAELVAEKYGISRAGAGSVRARKPSEGGARDEVVFRERADCARSNCRSARAPPVVIKFDESPREDTSLEALAKLKPAFKKEGGTVTAGNAPGTNDGAAAVVVTSEKNAARLGKAPMARIVAQAVSGVEPKWVMMAPVDAVEKLLAKTGWDRDKDVDLYELNEAFAVAAIAVTRAAEARSRESECEWRRGRVGSSDWRVRRARAGHAALRIAAPESEARDCGAVPRRRECRGAGRRAPIVQVPSLTSVGLLYQKN